MPRTKREPRVTAPTLEAQNVSAAIDAVEDAGLKMQASAKVIKSRIDSLERALAVEIEENAREVEQLEGNHAKAIETLTESFEKELAAAREELIAAKAKAERAEEKLREVREKNLSAKAILGSIKSSE